MEVKLKEATVDVKDSLTWGDTNKIQAALMTGSKVSGKSQDFDFDATAMIEAKYVALECAVVKVTDKDNKDVKFTREWMDNLSQDDGNKLMDTVDDLQKKDQGTPSA